MARPRAARGADDYRSVCLTDRMLLMLACGALLLIAVVAAWRWRHYILELPDWAAGGESDRATPFRALVWLLAVALLTGLLVGVLVVGPAGRLAMRLLAATSPDVQGQLTEADQVIGEISFSGTLGFFVFVGLPGGLMVGLTYVLASFLLPRGVLGGAIYGAAVLVLFGSTIDPLREENPDFDLVGPGWLSVTTFCVMAVLTGILAAPIAGRIAAALHEPKVWWLLWLLPLGFLGLGALAVVPAALLACLIGCVVLVAALLVPAERRTVVWHRGKRLLQAVLALLVAAAAPTFVSAASAIVG